MLLFLIPILMFAGHKLRGSASASKNNFFMRLTRYKPPKEVINILKIFKSDIRRGPNAVITLLYGVTVIV